NITQAADIADKAISAILQLIKVGMTEKELARKLELIIEELGSEKVAFETIVASGVHTALPHHRTSNKEIVVNEPVLLDFGATVNGYCSDMTRTIFIGNPSDEYRNIYNLVLKAHDEAIRKVKTGVTGQEIHQTVLDVFGKEQVFLPHSTGHGVGLEIHEGPRLSLGSNEILKENMVVTVEPGLYYEGKFGVRIEDLGVVTKKRYKNLYKNLTKLIQIT